MSHHDKTGLLTLISPCCKMVLTCPAKKSARSTVLQTPKIWHGATWHQKL